MAESQEITPGKLPEGLSLEVARKTIEQLPINGWDKVSLMLTILDFKVGTDITPPDEESFLRMMEQILEPGKIQKEVESILRENNGAFKVPPEIFRQAYMAFQGFELSGDNWQDELVTVRRWAEAIWSFDKGLYQGIVGSRYGSIEK